MDRMLYVAMTGAKQTMLAQTANSHNLANASTSGFRADFSAFRAMPVFGNGYPSRVYAMNERPGVDLAPGVIIASGRDLDVAVNSEGWIAVQAPDGSEAYTRAGDFRISTNGVLVTGAGHPVLGSGGPIALPPAEKVDIGSDGTISIRPSGQSAAALSTVDRIKLVNPAHADLYKDDFGLMRAKPGVTVEADARVTVTGGNLESSNVNVADALVNMISLARQFDIQIKAMHTTDENETASAQLMRLTSA
jgi:flagellar basal-body rod protein FlgF